MRDVMKRKIFCWAVVVVLVVASFVSCGGKKAKANEFGFYEDLDEAKTVAKKQKKDILLFVTMGSFDSASDEFREKVLSNAELKSLLGDKFVFVNFDFGEDTYAATEVPQGATKDEQAAAEAKLEQVMKNMQYARTLNIQITPVAYILTEDGYVINQLYCDGFDSPSQLANSVNNYSDDLEKIKSLVDATKKGSVSDRMNALNSIYEEVDETNVGTYAELFKQAPEIDKKNETGLVSKIYFESVIADCMSFYSVGDYGSAIQILTAAAQSGKLDKPEIQESYYLAGYLLVAAGSDDVSTILGYFTLAIQAYPEGENNSAIQGNIDMISSLLEAANEENEMYDSSGSSFFDLSGAK